MPQIAYLECARCGHRVSAEVQQTRCPVDAGPLFVRYDMELLRKTAHRERPAELAAASAASLGMWRYADVLPGAAPVTLGEGWTPMRHSRRHAGLFIKDEGANPTGTYKARGIGLAVTMARDYGVRHVALASAGDAAAALAAYAAAGNLAAHIFMPQDTTLASYLENVVHGADVTMVNGAVSDCAELLAGRIRQQRESGVPPEERWLDVSTQQEPFCLEGEKTVGYELMEQLGWQYPDAVIYPGNTSGLLGMWKAFEEMEQLGWVKGRRPSVYVVQAAEQATMPGKHADSERADELDEDALTLDIVRESGGSTIPIAETETLVSLLDWGKEEGLFLCLEGAAAAAGYSRLFASGAIREGERVVLFNSGSALNDAETIAKALHLRRPGKLPISLPVGGIITPV